MPQKPILPQQPNYTIHISRAATGSRAPTQTAHFSEAEGTDSDNNDDRPSWQEVSGRGENRTGPRTTEMRTTERDKLQGADNHPAQVTVTNKCELLRRAETESNNKHERKEPAPTSTYVAGITGLKRLTATCEQVLDRLRIQQR